MAVTSHVSAEGKQLTIAIRAGLILPSIKSFVLLMKKTTLNPTLLSWT